MPNKKNKRGPKKTLLTKGEVPPAVNELELLKQKIQETQELFQQLSDLQARQQYEKSVAEKNKMSALHLLIPADLKLKFDLYRVKAGLSFKRLMISATEEYIKKHPL